jgi:hypothetical protein
MLGGLPSPLQVVYAGLSGVVHPSRTLYQSLLNRAPEADGHKEYEAAPVLASALGRWPNARIILTSTLPWKHGLFSVLTDLGPELASRVLGFTYADLTAKARLGPRGLPLGNADYWRHTKSEIVRLHVGWLRPDAWIAVDDDTLLWTEEERRQHFVQVDGHKGLLDPAAQDRLLTKLHGNFGDPTAPAIGPLKGILSLPDRSGRGKLSGK